MRSHRLKFVKIVAGDYIHLQRQVNLSGIDLRWGITSEQTNKGETLKICLTEVGKCKPYFICLLGNRYGWAQPLQQSSSSSSSTYTYGVDESKKDGLLAKTFQIANSSFPWVMDYQDRSMTELEVREFVRTRFRFPRPDHRFGIFHYWAGTALKPCSDGVSCCTRPSGLMSPCDCSLLFVLFCSSSLS